MKKSTSSVALLHERPWSENEIQLILPAYFSMLLEELSSGPVNKSEYRRRLMPLLDNRSDKSVDFKHMNISAVLVKHGLPYIKGYKPLWNFQRVLEEKVLAYLRAHQPLLEVQFHRFAEEPMTVNLNTAKMLFEYWLDSPPERKVLHEPTVPYRRLFKANYLEREQHNRSIGEAGEQLALEYERWRLISSGKESLADKVEWIAKEWGDGAGFDILSRNPNGTDRYIEVKTTKLGKEAPIFFSRNEYDFSIEHAENYHLYRIFDFAVQPKMFGVQGRFDDFCAMEAVAFKGWF